MSEDLVTLLARFNAGSDDPALATMLAFAFLQQARRWTEAGLAVCPTSVKLKARLAALAALLEPATAGHPN